MNKIIFTILFLTTFWVQISYAQNHWLGWVNAFGDSNGKGATSAMDLDVDSLGNSYITGFFRGEVDFDPRSDTFILRTKEGHSAFISKYNTEGNLIWVKEIKTSNYYNIWGRDVTLDNFGNVIFTGAFRGTCDLNPGPGTDSATADGSLDGFLIKLDTAGNYLWSFKIGEGGTTEPSSIITDQSGNIYVSGYFYDTTDFDPGPGIKQLINTPRVYDMFLAKYDPSGNLIWVTKYNALKKNTYVRVVSIVIDKNGDLITSGHFAGKVDFDPGPGFYVDSTKTWDGFVAKHDANGSLKWVHKMASITSQIYINGVNTDGQNNVYVAGQFAGFGDFNPGSGKDTMTSSGHWDSFVVKLNTNGVFEWFRGFGSAEGWDFSQNMIFDENNDVLLYGSFSDSIDIDPGPNEKFLYAPNEHASFLMNLSKQGDFKWAYKLGGVFPHFGTFRECSNMLGADKKGNLYVTGMFEQTTDFDPSYKINALNTKGGAYDAFLVKLCVECECVNDSVYKQITECDQYTFLGNVLKVSGTYIDTTKNIFGCDSIIQIDLTINQSSDTTVIIDTACDVYTFEEQAFYNTGIYYINKTNKYGCDSTLSLNLTINKVGDSLKQHTIDPDTVLSFETVIFSSKQINGSQVCWTIDELKYVCENTIEYFFENNGTYFIEYKVTDSNMCTYYDTTYVLVKNHTFYIPNSFTPNGDNLNDSFGPLGHGFTYTMTILNKWGEVIYEGENQHWDGSGAVNDSYVFYIDAINTNGEHFVKKGQVLLLR